MDMSNEVLVERYQVLRNCPQECGSGERYVKTASWRSEDNVINVDEIEFSDDELWLCKPKEQNSNISDLQAWLRKQDVQESPRNVDSRTFTRPKKRFTRPSLNIQKLQENSDIELPSNELIPEEEKAVTSSPLNITRPLEFDLSQPLQNNTFESILKYTCDGADSFQNMSPPSLVNSMCSSTFQNLMENSYIKNDPALCEIRDADYTEIILLDDADPPLFQSMIDSCASTDSNNLNVSTQNQSTQVVETKDMSTSFIVDRKTGEIKEYEKQFDNVFSNSEVSLISDTTYRLSSTEDSSYDLSKSIDVTSEKHTNLTQAFAELGLQNIDPNTTVTLSPVTHRLNGTYRKGSKLNGSKTFSSDSLDENVDLNTTFSKTNTATFSRSELKKRNLQNKSNGCDDSIKRNSFGYSAGSADSLDCTSSLSNSSSRGSNKMLNMAEVDAIVHLQEQSLQVISTPKPTNNIRKLYEAVHLSPITAKIDRSDSDLSSSDEYATVRSKLSPAASDSEILSSDGGTYQKKDGSIRNKPLPRSIYTLGARNVAGSYSNLRNVGKGSRSNLNSVGAGLRGSYTSLKPVNKILPVVAPHPANSDTNATITIEPNDKANETFRIPKAVGVPSKPQARVSSLPRPVGSSTGIPRPVSRIPAPQSSRLTGSRSVVKQGRRTNDGYY